MRRCSASRAWSNWRETRCSSVSLSVRSVTPSVTPIIRGGSLRPYVKAKRVCEEFAPYRRASPSELPTRSGNDDIRLRADRATFLIEIQLDEPDKSPNVGLVSTGSYPKV